VISRFIEFSFGWWQLEEQIVENNGSELCWFVFVILRLHDSAINVSPKFFTCSEPHLSIINPNHSFFGCHSFIHSFICDPDSWIQCLFEPMLGSSCALYVLWRTFSSDSNSLNSQFHIHKWNWELHTVKDVVKLSIHPVHPSRHPSMDGVTAAHVVKILLYT
jgi:hypothetical protein